MPDGLETPVFHTNRQFVVRVFWLSFQIRLLAGLHVHLVILHSYDASLNFTQKLLFWAFAGMVRNHDVLLRLAQSWVLVPEECLFSPRR